MQYFINTSIASTVKYGSFESHAFKDAMTHYSVLTFNTDRSSVYPDLPTSENTNPACMEMGI